MLSQECIYILGVRVDRVSQAEALEAIERMVAQRRAGNNTLLCQQVVTVNTEFVMAAQQNDDFRIAINAAALVVADGIGIVWATRYLGKPTPERVTGTDTVVELAKRCAASSRHTSTPSTARGLAPASTIRRDSPYRRR